MPNDLIPSEEEPLLPALPQQMLPGIAQLVGALGIPREVLAPDKEIHYAWRDLPRELAAIPKELRGELIARMCVAVSTGLFDGAINYAWNATILHLRQTVRNFGIPIVAQITQKPFEETTLLELKDADLLDLLLKLGLVSEDGFFFLDQCRETRNNFSAAHPTIGKINDREFITFLNRCTRYALAAEAFPRGIDASEFIKALKGARFNTPQLDFWIKSLKETHDAQRQLLFGTIHGIYCDPSTSEPGRLNALDLCAPLFSTLSDAVLSNLLNNHVDYTARGDSVRHSASIQFFEKLGALNLLSDSDRHSVISNAISRLWSVHQGMDNFYNEPPFAERLEKISEQGPIPESVQEQYVRSVVGCRIGNGYGVCRAAIIHYDAMIKGFSPREVGILTSLGRSPHIVGRRIREFASCRKRFIDVVRLIDKASVPNSAMTDYEAILKG